MNLQSAVQLFTFLFLYFAASQIQNIFKVRSLKIKLVFDIQSLQTENRALQW